MRQTFVSLGILVAAFAAVNACGEVPAGRVLWELGLPDNDNVEFALAPSGHARYARDAFFVVGRSETKRDWPYVRPGPAGRAFASELRAEYAHYDNLNIEIFDEPQCAEEYAERHVSDPKHRVMSVSKHAASGRDVILFLHDGKATEVPATAE